MSDYENDLFNQVMFNEGGECNGVKFDSIFDLLHKFSGCGYSQNKESYNKPNSTKAYKKSRKRERQNRKKGRRK